MNPALPPALAAAIATLLEGVSRKDLARRAQSLSDAYREGRSSAGIKDDADAGAYVVARMPATFAATAAAFAKLAEAAPGFAPRSLLDVGAGSGAASWAAVTAWPGLQSLVMLDHNPALRRIARRLADAGPLIAAQIVAGDLGSDKPQSDLVVASYVLAELPQAAAAATALHLWDSAASALVLVEPGTPQGFARIRAARAALIDSGAHVAAPCTHQNTCPITGDDWCHFSQRLPRLRDHMQMKGAQVPFEDERHAFVAVMRQPVPHTGGRILSPPLDTRPGLTFKLCDGDGLRARFVARRDRPAYRAARKLSWGDLL